MSGIFQGSHTLEMRPRYEGSNICSWIGFKHVMYMMEEALLSTLNKHDLGKGKLFEKHGLCLEIVDSSIRILHAFHMDDQAQVEVEFCPKSDDFLEYNVRIFLERDQKKLKAGSGKIRATLRQYYDQSQISKPAGALLPYIVQTAPVPPSSTVVKNNLARGVSVEHGELLALHKDSSLSTFIWEWHVPYFYCHFTNRMQHSGYLRLMEEVVDLFLADRGISIRTMLEKKNWIPVVPSAQVSILEDAFMEEQIYTVYTVKDIFKDFVYTAGFDCYVERDGKIVHTATGTITHGYAVIDNRWNWTLVNLDADTIDALRGAELGT